MKRFIMTALLVCMVLVLHTQARAGDAPVTVALRMEKAGEMEGLPVYMRYRIEPVSRNGGEPVKLYERYSFISGTARLYYRASGDTGDFRELDMYEHTAAKQSCAVELNTEYDAEYRDRVVQPKHLKNLSPGRYEMKVAIRIDRDNRKIPVYSNTAEFEVHAPAGTEASAYRQWLSARDQKSNRKKMELLKELVRKYPGTRYACYSRVAIGAYCGNEAKLMEKYSNYTSGKTEEQLYQEALEYVLPVLNGDDYVGCMDRALEVARICSEKLGKTQLASSLRKRLLKEYPRSIYSKKAKREMNS